MMSNPDSVVAIRQHALDFLCIIDDVNQAREVRVFASDVVGWALFYVRDDEWLISEVLLVLRRAVDRDDEPPLLLLRHLPMRLDRNIGAGIVRLGERALELGRTTALARITWELTREFRSREPSDDGILVPARWIRALVGTAIPETADSEVLPAVAAWLDDDRSDVDAVRDLIAAPAAWVTLNIERM